jgi:hypothetical protein
MSGSSENQTIILYEITHYNSFLSHIFLLHSIITTRCVKINCFYVVFMCSLAVNSLAIAPKFSIVIMIIIVDLKISIYLESKLRFIVRREDGNAISCRYHIRFNHEETM